MQSPPDVVDESGVPRPTTISKDLTARPELHNRDNDRGMGERRRWAVAHTLTPQPVAFGADSIRHSSTSCGVTAKTRTRLRRYNDALAVNLGGRHDGERYRAVRE